MPQTPEDKAREQIDKLLTASGWVIQDRTSMNLAAAPGVAVREMSLAPGYGEADYLLYVDRKALGVVEAKKEGETLTGVELQTARYAEGLPANLRAWWRPLPFLYQSTGVETRFTNTLDPQPRSRRVFTFHRPQTLCQWVKATENTQTPPTVLGRLREMPDLITDGMRPAQITAIRNLEESLRLNKPRALIQMTMGSGKTYAAVAQIYRLIKFGGFKRILFLVDRGNLGRQTLKEFQNYTTPDDGRKFTEIYNVQHMQSNKIDDVSCVCITTIQRLYSMLKGDPDFDPAQEEISAAEMMPLRKDPLPVIYNPNVPIETFDLIITDECHRSIYNLWRQVIEYFDSYLVGLTATPSKQTFGFFNQNLVMEYGRAQGVADGVNVDFDVYRIRTKITEQGETIEAKMFVDKRSRKSRRVRWEALDEDLTYTPNQLDESVVSESQIRTVIRTFRDRLFTEIFPGRTEVPKTLVFAKTDSHADDIVQIIREEFGKGNDFCEKITSKSSTARIVDAATGDVSYKSTGLKAEDLLSAFRNSYNPRIAVTVDMIATGTDVKPLEIVFFMRDVKSANYFEQMLGRGSRVISSDDLKGVTPDATAKTRFVIVDAVGVCERERVDTPSLDRQPSVPLNRVLNLVAQGSTEEDVVSTLASRMARLDRQLTPAQRVAIEEVAGVPFRQMLKTLVEAVDPDAIEALAQQRFETSELTEEQLETVAEDARFDAVTPFLNNMLRDLILQTQAENDQIIDRVSEDEVLYAGVSEDAKIKAEVLTISFAEYLKQNKDEIAALQFLYSQPQGKAPTLRQLKELAAELKRPPRFWTPEALWDAYEMLEKPKVKGRLKATTDLISLIRFALEQATVLAPFDETVNDRFAQWMSSQEAAGTRFTAEQKLWLEMIRDHIAESLSVEPDDFDLTPFSVKGGLGKAYALFGDRLNSILQELNVVLTV